MNEPINSSKDFSLKQCGRPELIIKVLRELLAAKYAREDAEQAAKVTSVPDIEKLAA